MLRLYHQTCKATSVSILLHSMGFSGKASVNRYQKLLVGEMLKPVEICDGNFLHARNSFAVTLGRALCLMPSWSILHFYKTKTPPYWHHRNQTSLLLTEGYFHKCLHDFLASFSTSICSICSIDSWWEPVLLLRKSIAWCTSRLAPRPAGVVSLVRWGAARTGPNRSQPIRLCSCQLVPSQFGLSAKCDTGQSGNPRGQDWDRLHIQGESKSTRRVQHSNFFAKPC